MAMVSDILDLYSTSQTKQKRYKSYDGILSPQDQRDIARTTHISKRQQADYCKRGAPFICYEDTPGKWVLVQGCCNNWECERCGHIRARKEYGRIVEGAQKLEDQGHALYFWTLTCRGADMPLETAESDYMKWTNRLLTACRAKCKRGGGFWCYMQVTERQQRLHPHSHILATFAPDDVRPYSKGDWLLNGAIAKHDGLWSDWFHARNVSAGLGPMCDLSEVQHAAAVAVYISKYLFKEAMTTKWPKGWRRIRYSRNWPKTDVSQKDVNAFPVMSKSDWLKVDTLPHVTAADDTVYYASLARLVTSVYPPRSPATVDMSIYSH